MGAGSGDDAEWVAEVTVQCGLVVVSVQQRQVVVMVQWWQCSGERQW